MGSFKFKLVSYFALVALVPVGAAFYGFDTLAKRHETQRIDNRLRADVRAAIAGYAQQLHAAARRAQPGRSGVRRRGRCAEAADGIPRGRCRERVRVSGNDEFAQVAAAFNRMAAQLEQRIVELEHERRRTREVTVRFGKALTATHDVD